MAPGRIDFGIGTGFTARRAMGLGAVKLAEMEEYIRVVYGLLRGETADFDMEGWQNTSPPPQEVAAEVAGYVEMARRFEPPDARYLTNHRGHFVFVKPEERKFVSAELIRRTTFTATEQALKQRVEALREAGWNQLVIAITPGEERALEDWARIKRAFD
jgi:5,10-methylenetetrahydromethanopterin reductase